MKIYEDKKRLNIKDVLVTDFKEQINNLTYDLFLSEIDFSSIKDLRGEKILLEQAFQDQLKEDK